MKVVDAWIRTEKTPVPQKEIIVRMEQEGEKSFTVVNALNALLRKGYIRRTHTSAKNRTHYVQLRGI